MCFNHCIHNSESQPRSFWFALAVASSGKSRKNALLIGNGDAFARVADRKANMVIFTKRATQGDLVGGLSVLGGVSQQVEQCAS